MQEAPFKKIISILIADDDVDDWAVTKEAFEESKQTNVLHFVENGEELMNYLRKKGKYSNLKNHLLPDVIMLDLNMPRKDGRETLKEIKSDPELCQIPVIIFTTSNAEEDILKTYRMGSNCFITKPATFEGMIKVTKVIGNWLETVELPHLRN